MAPDPSPPTPSPDVTLSRRTVLRGAAALGAIGAVGGLGLAACGGADDEPTGDDGSPDAQTGLSLVTVLNSAASLAAGSDARLPLALGDDRGTLIDDSPAKLTFAIRSVDGDVVADSLTVSRHAAGLPHAYYPLGFVPPAAGDYTATTEVDGTSVEAAFTVSEASAIVIPRPGEPFPTVSTPTLDAPAGVDPLCTREPACPLHDTDLTALLGTSPVALLVSTPAFCQQAICGPVLDVLLGARADTPGVRFLHVEVYEKASEVEALGLDAPLSPAVEALQLPFEPCLFLIAADGTLARRLDVIFDEVELSDGLAALTA